MGKRRSIVRGPNSDPYQEIIAVRVTTEQYMRLVLAAREGGHSSLSAYIRAATLDNHAGCCAPRN